ncbi:MAG: hypothetical protein WBC68_11060 [Albidovulum sp.]
MKYVQAVISIGFFGWLAFAVFTGAFPGGDGGSSKTRALKSMVGSAIDTYGAFTTAFGIGVIGLVLAGFFLVRGREVAED